MAFPEEVVLGPVRLRRPAERDRAGLADVLAGAGGGVAGAGADGAAAFDDEVAGPWAAHGFGPWVVEAGGVPRGYGGLRRRPPGTPHAGEVELVLVLDPGGGAPAAEVAGAAVRAGFDDLGATRLLARRPGRAAGSEAGALGRIGFRRLPSGEGGGGWLELTRLGAAGAVVRAFTPVEAAQADARARTLALCEAHQGALGRSLPGHVTSSALVVAADGERVLVLWHEKLRIWVQPGGHVDGDWDLARSALREAVEETCIDGLRLVSDVPVDLDVHRVAPPAEAAHDHHDVRFVVAAPAGAEPVANAEARRFAWVRPAELGRLGADESLVRLARVGLPVAGARRPPADRS